MKKKRILITESNSLYGSSLAEALTKEDYECEVLNNGSDALAALSHEKFDVLIINWMMLGTDGIRLTRQVREQIHPAPGIIMLSSLASGEAIKYALDSGVDDYIVQPVRNSELISKIKRYLEKRIAINAETDTPSQIQMPHGKPNYFGIAIASGIGGLPAVLSMLAKLPSDINACVFIVQHGPTWMLESLATRINNETLLKAELASDDRPTIPGRIYIARNNKHLMIEPNTFNTMLSVDEKASHKRPSADILFRSIANAFGKKSIAVVMSGLGRDASVGAMHISLAGGIIIVQNPMSAVSPQAPLTAIRSIIDAKVLQPSEMSKCIMDYTDKLAVKAR